VQVGLPSFVRFRILRTLFKGLLTLLRKSGFQHSEPDAQYNALQIGTMEQSVITQRGRVAIAGSVDRFPARETKIDFA
jgi:hypothetical protein